MHNFTWFHHIKSKLRFAAALVAALVLTAACSSASDSATQTEIAPTEAEPTETTVAAASPAAESANPAEGESAAGADTSTNGAEVSTPAGRGLDWVVAEMLNNPTPDLDEVEARFSPDFLAVVPVEQIVGLLPELQRSGNWSILEADIGELQATGVVVATDGTELDANLVMNQDDSSLIDGLLFTPRFDTEAVAAVETVEDYAAALDQVAPSHPVGIFEIVDGECRTAIDLGADDIMPIGSIFKLWVLAELAHQIEAGTMTWQDTIPVQDIYKSSPDGTIYQMQEGREVSLFEFASEMISVSDNSATDHLLFHLGRANVEEAMIRAGVSQPERNIPMLATAELFRIKFDPTPPNSSEYRALDSDGRRDMLDAMQNSAPSWVGNEDVPVPVNGDGVPATEPRDHDLEWFATPADLCRTHAYLAELAEIPGLEPIADITRTNADARLTWDLDTWTDLRFKGGSEPGLVAVAWRLERNDGRTFVLAGGVEDTETPVEVAQALTTLVLGADLAADID